MSTDEKQTASSENQQEEIKKPESSSGKKFGNKPVVIYIMILFIAAFLLMALSFFMHQRSNSEVMGELQNSVEAIYEIQADQETLSKLQEELIATQETLAKEKASYQEKLDKLQTEADTSKVQNDALNQLYCLQQAYSAKDYEVCVALIEKLEKDDLYLNLPTSASSKEVGTPPSQRFQELRGAVLNIVATQKK